MAKRLPTFWLILGVLLSSTVARAAGWHADREAGVRLPLPFEDVERKTSDQVTNLILERPGARIPTNVKYTSGLYAKSGIPFLLIWTRSDPMLPSQDAIDEQDFDREKLDRIVEGQADPKADGLRSRVLVRQLRGHSVFIGLYYKEPKDGALLDQIRATLEVEPDRALSYDELESSGPSWWLVALVALGAFAGGFILWRQRMKSAPTQTTRSL